MKKPIKSTQVIEPKVRAIIYGHGRGWVFTPTQLFGVGDQQSVRVALSRLLQKGTIRLLARGLYDYPRQDPQLGVLAPSVDAVAKALTSRHAIRLQPTGGYAANLLGLSDQVPMKVVFLTDGTNRKVNIGKLQVILKRTSPRNMGTAGKTSGLVIQAIRHLGKTGVDQKIVQKLRQRLSAADKKQLLTDLRFAPIWVANIMKQIAQP